MRRKHTEFLLSYGTLQLEAVQMATFGRQLAGTSDALRGFEHHTMAKFTGRASDLYPEQCSLSRRRKFRMPHLARLQTAERSRETAEWELPTLSANIGETLYPSEISVQGVEMNHL